MHCLQLKFYLARMKSTSLGHLLASSWFLHVSSATSLRFWAEKLISLVMTMPPREKTSLCNRSSYTFLKVFQVKKDAGLATISQQLVSDLFCCILHWARARGKLAVSKKFESHKIWALLTGFFCIPKGLCHSWHKEYDFWMKIAHIHYERL